MDFLDLATKKIVVFGLANRKSVACAIAKLLQGQGAEVIHVVRSPARRETAEKLFPGARIFICDVENEDNIRKVKNEIKKSVPGKIHGIVHSIAFANYGDCFKPFHETQKQDFLQAVDISCFSLMAISNHFKELLDINGSVVTISISTTKMFPGQEFFRLFQCAVQRCLPRAAQDFCLGWDTRLRRQLPLC